MSEEARKQAQADHQRNSQTPMKREQDGNYQQVNDYNAEIARKRRESGQA